jgi:hypothetical protein
MRKFSELKEELSLVYLAYSSLGDLYVSSAASLVVRYLNRDLPPSLAPAYADLISAANAWIGQDLSLAAMLRVEPVVEVGNDFVSRSFVTGDSLRSFEDDEDPPAEVPDELELVQTRFRELREETQSMPRDALIATVLSRSVLEPTDKTIFSYEEEKFVVADIKPTPDEVERWGALSGAGG